MLRDFLSSWTYIKGSVQWFFSSAQVLSRPIFTLSFLRELVCRVSSSILHGSLQWWICCFSCHLLPVWCSITFMELIHKLIYSDHEGLFSLSWITRKLLYAYAFFSISHIYISKKLYHNFHLSFINKESNPSPNGKTITAGIFSKRIHLSHLFIFFILMSYFWLQAHNSYSSFLRCTLKAVWQKDGTFLAVVLYLLLWC